jgi:AraC family transcriptional regulator
MQVVARRHEGSYEGISTTFELHFAAAVGRGWFGPGSRTFGLYYDDPAGTPEAAQRSDACITAPDGFTGDGDLRPLTIEGGRYAVLLHVGPYAELPAAYMWLYRDWLAASGEETDARPCVEEYIDDPRRVPASELRTEIWLPLQASVAKD